MSNPLTIMEEDYGFCTRCGAEHQSDAQFCPQCGKSFTDEPVNINNRLSSNPLTFFLILIGIFAAISLVEGIIATFFNDSLISYVKTLNGDDLDAYLSGMGLETVEQLADILYKEGVMTLIDGILVLFVFILCFKCRYWKAAVAICLIASILVPTALIFMPLKMMQSELFSVIVQTAIGLLITRGIYVNKGLFK